MNLAKTPRPLLQQKPSPKQFIERRPAPPVYRPAAAPSLLQQKPFPKQFMETRPAPPVYRAAAAPSLLQQKPSPKQFMETRPAPPVYRAAAAPSLLQQKPSPKQFVVTRPAPAVYRPTQPSAAPVQAKSTLPFAIRFNASPAVPARLRFADRRRVIQPLIKTMPQDFLDKRTRGRSTTDEELKSHIDAYMREGVDEKSRTFLEVVREVVNGATIEDHRRSVEKNYLEYLACYDSGRYEDASDMLWTLSHFINSLYLTFKVKPDGTSSAPSVSIGVLKAEEDASPLREVRPESGGVASHREKAERELKNKERGSKSLSEALDQLESGKSKDVEQVINGFTLAKKWKQVMVVLFRKMTKGEAEAMKSQKKISRKEFTDSYKWFSETSSHGESFSNKGAKGDEVLYKVYIQADDYLAMRKNVEPETFSGAAQSNRFHQENLGKETPLINFGVHSAEEDRFNATIIKIEPVKGKK